MSRDCADGPNRGVKSLRVVTLLVGIALSFDDSAALARDAKHAKTIRVAPVVSSLEFPVGSSDGKCTYYSKPYKHETPGHFSNRNRALYLNFLVDIDCMRTLYTSRQISEFAIGGDNVARYVQETLSIGQSKNFCQDFATSALPALGDAGAKKPLDAADDPALVLPDAAYVSAGAFAKCGSYQEAARYYTIAAGGGLEYARFAAERSLMTSLKPSSGH